MKHTYWLSINTGVVYEMPEGWAPLPQFMVGWKQVGPADYKG